MLRGAQRVLRGRGLGPLLIIVADKKSQTTSCSLKRDYFFGLVVFFFAALALVTLDVTFLLVELVFLVTLFLLLLAFLLVALLLFLVALPGRARQCDLVFLPFLSTEPLRHVHIELLDEHAELLKPTHALCAADVLMTPKLNAFIVNKLINIFFIDYPFL